MSSSYRTFSFFDLEGQLVEGQLVGGDDTSDLDEYLNNQAEGLRRLADKMEAESSPSGLSEYSRNLAYNFDAVVHNKQAFKRHTEDLFSRMAMLSQLLDDVASEAAEPSKGNSSTLVRKVNKARRSLKLIAKRKTYQVTSFDEVVLDVWNLALERQKLAMVVSKDSVTAGQKMLDNLEAARASRRGPTLEEVERVLGRLQQSHPKLSETRRRALAAKELKCDPRTIIRRLKKKSSDN